MEPRVVLVTRPTELEELVAAFGTLGHARWMTAQAGQDITPAIARHDAQQAAVDQLWRAIPSTWRQVRVSRQDLDRFLFEPDDLVVAVGQDGLVANVAKYLDGQPVIGVNPGGYEGVLVQHSPAEAAGLLLRVADRGAPVEVRTMVEAVTDDGQRLRALNEIYVGHRTHQSSRYRLTFRDLEERQSSSGVLCATGTGCTGWALSVARTRRAPPALPSPSDPDLVWFVREAWPSRATGADLVEGRLAEGEAVSLVSEMHAGGVMFGDGIEADAIELPFARTVTLRRASASLRLIGRSSSGAA